MPLSRYLNAYIGGRKIDLSSLEDFPISISYRREDPDDFQRKKSSEALSTTIPATVTNDYVANTFHNPGIEDLTEGQIFRNFQRGLIEANGYELLVGKVLLTQARHHSVPLDYEFDWYGGNGDWILDLKEKTLYDFLKHITFTFDKETIISSWAGGLVEEMPFVFAPVRYGQQLDEYDNGTTKESDRNMKPEYMKPSLSVYWIIYWAFKSIGYRVNSNFMESDLFTKLVMPWTFGNFLFSEGTRLNSLDFLAKSTETQHMLNVDFTGFWDLVVSNDSTDGAFDNNGSYEYDSPNKEMEWTYLPAFDYGPLIGHFHINLAVQAVATANSDVELRVQWFKNGVKLDNGNDNGNGTLLVELNAPDIGRRDFIGQVDDWLAVDVVAGDVISAKIYLHTFKSNLGIARIHASVDAYELEYFRIPIGGTIDFSSYESLKKYKFLDFLGGICDCFNISPGTDPINKVVYIEPEHPYRVTPLLEQNAGYLTGNIFNWTEKQDISKEKISDLFLFNDSDRELIFKFKEDGNDGLLKVVQDRHANKMGLAKYVLPDRFKEGNKEKVNRFFSAVMHVELTQWGGLGGEPGMSPQIVCLVPENISNTSRQEAQNTFEPKLCYYRGVTNDVGWIFDNEIQDNYPFMFAVNYQQNGDNDPVLSYSDERIGPVDFTVAQGLLRRFFLQRLAIMRNGQYYNTHFRLNNLNVTNFLHREHIVCRDQKWELVEIKDYQPLREGSTACFLRKHSPVAEADWESVFPSEDNVGAVSPPTGTFDIKYNPMLALISDIPTTSND